MKTKLTRLIVALSVLALPALVQAQFTFTTNNGAITITGYNTAAGLNVVIPAMTNGYPVTSIGDSAFNSSGLTSVTIPNSVTTIGAAAFDSCNSLANVTIPNSVTSIGEMAFVGSSLTSVNIPASVTSIGVYAFRGPSLTNINVDAANPAFSSLGGVLFDKAQTTLLDFPGGLGGSYTIPNSITTIGLGAFDSSGITKVTIPNSVTTIGNAAFYSCTSLTSVTIPNSVTSIGHAAFYECSGLTSVTIPNRVTSIGSYAFGYCFSLTTAYFLGNAPPDDGTVFADVPADPTTVYYLAGTTGWSSFFGGVPAVLWNPQANTFSLSGGQFGFSLTGPANAVIVVEACTNLSHPVWLPVSINTLSGLGTSAFSDPQSGGYPMRFYRFRSP